MALTETEEALLRELLAQKPELDSLADNEAAIIAKLAGTKVALADLTAAASVSGTDLTLIVQGGTAKKSTVGAIATAIGVYGDAKIYGSYSSAAAGTYSAGDAVVVFGDAGTHTDPVVGGTVPNEGVYIYSASPAGLRWISPLVSQAIAAAVPSTQILGRATSGVLASPSSGLGTQEWVFADPVTVDSIASRLWIHASTAGAVRFDCFTKSGNNFTPVAGKYCTIAVNAGAQTIDIFGLLRPSAGEYIGVRGQGVAGITTATADGTGLFLSGNDYVGGTFTQATVTTGSRLQLGIEFVTLRTLQNGGTALSTMLDKAIRGVSFGIGRFRALATSGTTNGNARQYILAEPATRNGMARRLVMHSTMATTVALRTYTRSGLNFTATGREHLVRVASGANDIALPPSLLIETGQFIGVSTFRNGAITVIADQDRFLSGYFDDAGAGTATFTGGASATTAFSLQARVEFDAVADLTPERRLSRGLVPIAERSAPKGHILVWVLGQSNAAGSANGRNVLLFPNGTGFKFDRGTSSAVALADPTGVSSSGSFGPAIGDALLNASNGQVGAYIVNSGLAATRIGVGWASGGAAWTTAVSDLSTALTAANTAGLNIVGCAVVWCQGESDADAAVTGAAYITAFNDLRTRIGTTIGSRVPILMVRTGVRSDGDTANYQAIRGAQDDIVETTDGVFMAHTRANDFWAENLQHDTYHYTPAGYDEIGRALGFQAFVRGFGFRPTGYAG